MSERVDLVDARGGVQLVAVKRDDAAVHSNLHMQIVIVVVCNTAGQFLVHQRSIKKKVNPGDVDNVCGGVLTAESPEDAARRETAEEAGVELTQLHLVSKGVNSYNRFRWLFVGVTEEQPTLNEPDDIAWLAWKPLAELETARDDGSLTFVDEFFDEIDAAQAKLTQVAKRNA